MLSYRVIKLTGDYAQSLAPSRPPANVRASLKEENSMSLERFHFFLQIR